MGKNEWDGETPGQISLFDDLALPQKMFSVSDIFARAKKQMNLSEYKTFVYALTQVKWTEEMPNIVYLDKKTLANIVKVNSDADHLSVDLHRSIKQLPEHSVLHFDRQDIDLYDDGMFVTRVTMLKNRVRIKFEEEYLSLFGKLQKDFITMWSTDIFQMKSERSITFYEHLRYYSDTRKENERGFGVKALKEMFNIPKEGKGSYMRTKGGFDRAQFEKRVIEPLCEDLSHCHMIQLIAGEDGKLYEKVKQGHKVMGYMFRWVVTDRPGVMNALEQKELTEEIEKNPAVLKVAKDIVDGKKKKGKVKKNSFHNFSERDYDFAELEKRFARN